MDHRKRMLRAANLLGWGSAGVSVMVAVVRSMATEHNRGLTMIGVWALANAANMVCVSGVPPLLRAVPGLRSRLRAIQFVLYLTNLLVQGGLLAVAGGLDTALWLLFLPTVLFAALHTSRVKAVLWGLATDGVLTLVAVVSHTLDREHTASFVVAIVLYPGMAWYLGAVTRSFYGMRADARDARSQLVDRVADLSGVLARTAEGDLTAVPESRPDDHEMAPLVGAMRSTVTDLRDLVGQLRGGGEQIRASAGELLATAQEHAASATEQSSAVTETTSTIEELAATAAQIADTAEIVARYAEQTLLQAAHGQEAVNASVISMDAIAEGVDSIATRALSLGEKSQEIGRILDVIDDLADQTNLLALNAAIEAARAGEHGRGFAVVATEVRKLAERAQESTGQIQAIVSEIQAETSKTIVASEEGARQVTAGAELARGVAEALDRISGMVNETTRAAREISIATQQQRSASDQVVAAMAQVADVSRQYAVGSRQTAAAASQLNALADDLGTAISRFRTS